MWQRCFMIAAGLTIALPSMAASPPLPAERAVSASGVDFRDPAAVRDLYGRLRTAAAVVCDGYAANSRVTRDEIVCADRALGEAVRRLDRPSLTTLHEGRGATRLPDGR